MVPLIVALGRSVPLQANIEATSAAHLFSEGQLRMDSAVSQPRISWPAGRRKKIELKAPVDGHGAYVGADITVSPETGFFVGPGQSVSIVNYHGPLWAMFPGKIPWLHVTEE
jgi:hypothetical protein